MILINIIKRLISFRKNTYKIYNVMPINKFELKLYGFRNYCTNNFGLTENILYGKRFPRNEMGIYRYIEMIMIDIDR